MAMFTWRQMPSTYLYVGRSNHPYAHPVTIVRLRTGFIFKRHRITVNLDFGADLYSFHTASCYHKHRHTHTHTHTHGIYTYVHWTSTHTPSDHMQCDMMLITAWSGRSQSIICSEILYQFHDDTVCVLSFYIDGLALKWMRYVVRTTKFVLQCTSEDVWLRCRQVGRGSWEIQCRCSRWFNFKYHWFYHDVNDDSTHMCHMCMCMHMLLHLSASVPQEKLTSNPPTSYSIASLKTTWIYLFFIFIAPLT